MESSAVEPISEADMEIFGKRVSTLFLIDRPPVARPLATPHPEHRPCVRDGLALARAAQGLRPRGTPDRDPKDRFSNQASA